ncbi:Protein-disulfide isomerase [Meinhardsimonia xiamenensis]|jgi:protein-disulfide isomerase|uniref:Protein-disulfide isomerase n=1 Tax=Meinhardsimonia xiamenensis TaxID=990712 RepID=A0A1G8YYL8_9RHOB|nr:DsbA family protein [Meinhardsimonia xiamenensis]PRX37486.1 protein-disulfide isomerase [Meinhardsimonia xiamenensis]SDK07886.1 Protein-disulfide isomerase [Meinhardsimonia xiamenensis]
MKRIFSTLTAAAFALVTLTAGAFSQSQSEVDTSLAPDFVLGNPDAPVTIVEYASFTCPHCRNFHAGPLKQLKADYIDTGKVKLVYREVYFDQFGLWAGMVARCVAQTPEGEVSADDAASARYFAMVDVLYEKQKEWLDATDAAGIADNLRRLGRAAGLSDERLDACLTNRDLALAMVARYQENATRDGVEATPSFVIGGTTYKNMAYEKMAELIEAELAKAE